MRIDSIGYKILLTDPPVNPTSNRRKMPEIIFEKYGFHSAYIAVQAALYLCAQSLQRSCEFPCWVANLDYVVLAPCVGLSLMNQF